MILLLYSDNYYVRESFEGIFNIHQVTINQYVDSLF